MFMPLEHENATLCRENRTLQKQLSAIESTAQQPITPRFQVLITHMQPLGFPDQGGASSSQLPQHFSRSSRFVN